jgi:hypothetical protein
MTRQQRRKLERDKLKGKSSLPTMFGMYYKDNTEEGFNLVVKDSNGNEIIEQLMRCFNDVKSCYRKEIKGVLNKEKGYKDGLKSLTKDVKYNLELGIENWNEIQNINSRDKGLTYNLILDFSEKNFCRIVFHIMYGIYFLVQQGLIVDDNYNGFMFMNKTLNGTVTHI